MNHEENQKLESSVFLINASFIAFETFNSSCSSASALGLISELNGSLHNKTSNALSLKYDQNSAEIISR